jgi:hypothetical protein
MSWTGLNVFCPGSEGPLKEYEMLELLDDLRVPHRKRIAKAIREHAERFPRYQSNVRVAKVRREEEPETEDRHEQKRKGGGCGCFVWLIIIVGILYFIGSNQDEFKDSTIITPPQEAVTCMLSVGWE